MGIRESMSRHSQISTMMAVAILVVAIGFIVWNLAGASPSAGSQQSFYTTDDGKTWFADDVNKLPPFDHDGMPAVRVVVFTFEGSQTPFAGYLVRYTPEAKAMLEEYQQAVKNRQTPTPIDLGKINHAGMEYKLPGTSPKMWVSQSRSYAQVMKVQDPLCPDGKRRPLQEVRP